MLVDMVFGKLGCGRINFKYKTKMGHIQASIC